MPEDLRREHEVEAACIMRYFDRFKNVETSSRCELSSLNCCFQPPPNWRSPRLTRGVREINPETARLVQALVAPQDRASDRTVARSVGSMRRFSTVPSRRETSLRCTRKEPLDSLGLDTTRRAFCQWGSHERKEMCLLVSRACADW